METIRRGQPWLLLSLVAACAAPPAPTEPTSAAASSPAIAPAPDERAGGPWSTSVLGDHPLVGRIADLRTGSFVSRAELEAACHRARFVLLGEKHDNPDHHRLQRELLQSIFDAGRRPALVFEMLDRSQQPAIDAWHAADSTDPDGFAEAVGWNERGWDWPLYRDLVGLALASGAPIAHGNLPRGDVRTIARQGAGAEPLAELTLPTLPAPQLAALQTTMDEAHCGMMPATMLPNMALVQRARDALMAAQLQRRATDGGAVLIAGAGHVRRDRGVPHALDAPDRDALVVAFVEVQASRHQPTDYVTAADTTVAPFDLIWFTPRLDDRDPCDELRAHGAEHRRAAH